MFSPFFLIIQAARYRKQAAMSAAREVNNPAPTPILAGRPLSSIRVRWGGFMSNESVTECHGTSHYMYAISWWRTMLYAIELELGLRLGDRVKGIELQLG